ncbi:MAG: NUDIX hydrolase, partial [Oscillospiraceae bacterium]|nr:NUDIX hydrolase [Oscillospiraceae bacterium]
MMELWDAYNKSFEKIEGVTLVRGENIPDGVYHLVSDVIVRHIDGTYLLMQRDIRKPFGGMWEATAGGSALKG